VNLENSAITCTFDKQSPNADATITLTHSTLDAITLRQKTFPQVVNEGDVKIRGDGARLQRLLGMLEDFNPNPDVATPNPTRQAK